MEVKERSGFIPALLLLAIVLVVAYNWDAVAARIELIRSTTNEFTRDDWSVLARIGGCALVVLTGVTGFLVVVTWVVRKTSAPPRKVSGGAVEHLTSELGKAVTAAATTITESTLAAANSGSPGNEGGTHAPDIRKWLPRAIGIFMIVIVGMQFVGVLARLALEMFSSALQGDRDERILSFAFLAVVVVVIALVGVVILRNLIGTVKQFLSPERRDQTGARPWPKLPKFTRASSPRRGSREPPTTP